ncbi:MAG TPA: helix-turn-helix domain-containing protein [Streptosporangiaceae bacterium]|jgi:AcrR family transcriptional regulator
MAAEPQRVAWGGGAEALLDAAERLLVTEGRDGLTTRRVARSAGVNQGLVYHHFGSLEELMLAVLERFTSRLIERQRAMYAEPRLPFLVKWRSAMAYLEQDLAAGYPKVWMELQALGWNRPELRARVAAVNEAWRSVLRGAFSAAREEYGLTEEQLPLEAAVAMVMTFNQGIEVERLSGISTGHAALLEWIDSWLAGLERGGTPNGHADH